MRIVIICILLVAFTVEVISQNSSKEGIVTVKMLSVYAEPSKDSKKIMSLSKNIRFKILRIQEGWYFIVVEGKKGWVEIEQTKLADPDNETIKNTEPEHSNKNSERQMDSEEEKSPMSSSEYPPSKIGLKIGGNYSGVGGNDKPENAEYRIGFSGGIFLNYRIHGGFELQSELLYNQKGYTQGDSTSKLDYVSLPVLLQFILGSARIKPFVNAGVEISYNTNKGLVTADETYIYDDINKFDYGAIFGAGLKYYLNAGRFVAVDFRYYLGLKTIHDKSVHDVDELDIKNNVLSVSFGYTF